MTQNLVLVSRSHRSFHSKPRRVSLHGSEESSSSRGMMTSFASIQPNFHHNYDRVDQHPIQFIGMRGFSVEEMECSSSVDERQEEEEIPLSIVQVGFP